MVVLALLYCLLPASRLLAEEWPSFRGPQGTGVSIEKALPESWRKQERHMASTPAGSRQLDADCLA